MQDARKLSTLAICAVLGFATPTFGLAQLSTDSAVALLRARLPRGAQDYLQLRVDSNPPWFRGVLFARALRTGYGAAHQVDAVALVAAHGGTRFVEEVDDLGSLPALGAALGDISSYASVEAWIELLRLTGLVTPEATVLRSPDEIPAAARRWYAPRSAVSGIERPASSTTPQETRATFYVRDVSRIRRFTCLFVLPNMIVVTDSTIARYSLAP